MRKPPFDPRALYLTPSGRLCRFVPGELHERAEFEYVRQASDSRLSDGFSLTSANWHLIRAVLAPGAGR